MDFERDRASTMQDFRLETEALDRVADALVTLGVAGNESDRRFEVHDIKKSQNRLEERLRRAGSVKGAISVEALDRPHDGVDLLVYDADRYAGLDQAERVWEQDYHARWHDIVERRVDDWLERLADLRLQMASWVASAPDLSDLSFVDLPPVPMSEELMQRFDVPPTTMPVFELRKGSRRVMRCRPKGLWIIGANGRVDLVTKSAAPRLFDQAEPLGRPSNWQIYDPARGGLVVPLTGEEFTALVR